MEKINKKENTHQVHGKALSVTEPSWPHKAPPTLLLTPPRTVLGSISCSVVSNSLRPHIYSPWNSPDPNTGVGSLSLLQGIFPTQGQTQVTHIACGFFTSWSLGKPQDTETGSLSLLQWIFPTQESNQGLLHCRQILYQLSYHGSPLSLGPL